jgi:hypothetical protein
MDFLGFFKEKMHFLEIKKIRFPLLNTPATPDPPARIRCGRLPAASMWLKCQWLPHAIP